MFIKKQAILKYRASLKSKLCSFTEKNKIYRIFKKFVLNTVKIHTNLIIIHFINIKKIEADVIGRSINYIYVRLNIHKNRIY